MTSKTWKTRGRSYVGPYLFRLRKLLHKFCAGYEPGKEFKYSPYHQPNYQLDHNNVMIEWKYTPEVWEVTPVATISHTFTAQGITVRSKVSGVAALLHGQCIESVIHTFSYNNWLALIREVNCNNFFICICICTEVSLHWGRMVMNVVRYQRLEHNVWRWCAIVWTTVDQPKIFLLF